MNRAVPFVLSFPLLLLAAGSAAANLTWAPGGQIQRTLAEGRPYAEVSPADGGAGLIHAAVDIAAPARVVWEVMRDCRLASRLVSTVTSCKVLQSDDAHGWDVRETITRGNIFIPSIHNVVRADYQPYSSIRFHKVGGNLKQEEGEWRLEPLAGGGTRVIYVNLVAANLLIPAPLVREGMRRDMAKVLLNLRQLAVSQPR